MGRISPAQTSTGAQRGSPALGPAGRRAWSWQAWAAIGVLGLILGVQRAEAPLGDSDVLWGARGGLDILNTGHIPHHDFYSWTVPGKAWIPNSWGWNVVLGIAHKVGGIAAIYVLGIALTIVLALVIGRASAEIGATPARTVMVFAILGRLLRFPLYARPQFIDYLVVFILAAIVPVALTRADAKAARAVVLVVVTQVVWMNLHTSAVLGPVLVAASSVGVIYGAEQAARRAVAVRAVGLTAATGLCCLATPYGTASITHIKEVRDASVGYIDEWQHIGFSGSGPLYDLVIVVVGLLTALLAWRKGRHSSAAMLVVLCGATASAIRFAPMVVFFAVPEYALLAGRLRMRESFANRIALLGAAVLGLLAAASIPHFAEPGADVWAPKLVAQLPHGCRVLNDYSIGGEILLTRPDVRVSWDGRNDLYGKHVELMVAGYLHNRPGTEAALDAHAVNCVLTNKSDPIAKALARNRHWRTAGAEGNRVLLLRA